MTHFKLRSLLMLGFGLLIGMLALIVGMGIFAASGAVSSIKTIVTYRMPNLINFGALETQVFVLRSQALSVFVQREATPAAADSINGVINVRNKAWADLAETKTLIDAQPPRR